MGLEEQQWAWRRSAHCSVVSLPSRSILLLPLQQQAVEEQERPQAS